VSLRELWPGVRTLAILLPIAVAASAYCEGFIPVNEGSKMAEANETLVTGDGPSVKVTREDAQAMAAALVRAVNDPAMVARSKAPAELLAVLRKSVGEAELTRGGQVRAGEWLMATTEAGLRWEYRVTLPAPPRIGLAFRAPLVRKPEGWQVTALDFLRIR
jgi:hypothetical protein